MRTKSIFTPWLLLLIFLCAGCIHNEDDYISKFCPGSCTVIKGKMTTANGTVPLPGVQLIATWDDVNFRSSLGGTRRRKAIAHTDANGNYELRFLLRDDELLDGAITVNTSIDETKFVTCGASEASFYSAGTLPRDTSLVVNYQLPRKATLMLQAENTEAITPDDEFRNTVTFEAGINGSDCTKGVNWNMSTLQQVEMVVAAEQPVIVETFKTRSGVRTTEADTLLLAPGQRFIIKSSF